jgi:hypothetical protein
MPSTAMARRWWNWRWTRLGTVRLLKITAAHDLGRAINPMLAMGQIEGGIAQGIGMALMEEYLPGRTENLHDYLIPTTGDMPPIESLLIEVPDPEGPFGAKGLGEHVLIPTAPAILNAIRHATGAQITRTRRCPTASSPPWGIAHDPSLHLSSNIPRGSGGVKPPVLGQTPEARHDRRSRKDPLRCLPGDVLHRAGPDRRLRPLCQ